MGVLKNPKHEAFCQARVLGRTQLQAYEEAGYSKPSDAVASRLSRNVKIAARLKELQTQIVEKYEITVDDIARKLDESYLCAKKWKVPSAMVQAQHVKAKLGGLLVERAQLQVTHNYSMMTLEEIRFEIAAIHAEARSLKAGVQH